MSVLTNSLCILLTMLNIVNMDVKLSSNYFKHNKTIHTKTSECIFNSTVIDNDVILRRVTLSAHFIFTGKIYSVETLYNDVLRRNRNVYKVLIRRVIKGELEILNAVKFSSSRALRFSGTSVLVESNPSFSCPTLRLRTYAIFLSKLRHKENSTRLYLTVDPVPLNLYRLERIEAAVKGK